MDKLHSKVVFKNFDELQKHSLAKTAPFACTSLIIKDTSDNVYHGRTMEHTFGEGLSSLTYYPKGFNFQHLAPDKSKGLAYQAKYPILAITTPISIYDPKCAMQGLNQAGLSFSLNVLYGDPLTDLTPKQYPNSVPFASFGQWALANFSRVEELKLALSQQVCFWSEELELVGGLKTPFHFIVYDKTGQSVVVEVDKGALIVYDNPTGVLTNEPEFPWHVENLNNYTNMSNVGITQAHINGITLRQVDCGIATSVLPSSTNSVGRFVRAFFYSSFANKVDDPDLQVAELAHVMSNFDRPKNITTQFVVSKENPDNPKRVSEFTLWIALSDLSRGKLYIRLYDHLNYKEFSFEQFSQENDVVTTLLV